MSERIESIDGIYEGRMYGAGPVVFAVWFWILAKVSRDGRVFLNPKVLANTLGGTEEEISAAITKLVNGEWIRWVDKFEYDVFDRESHRSRLMGNRREQNRRCACRFREKKKARGQMRDILADLTVTDKNRDF